MTEFYPELLLFYFNELPEIEHNLIQARIESDHAYRMQWISLQKTMHKPEIKNAKLDPNLISELFTKDLISH